MSQFALMKQRKFAPLFWTQFLGAFNDNLLKNALVILLAFEGTAVWGIPAEKVVILAGGIFILPFFLFSATAGQLADSIDKSRLVRIVKAVEIGIMVLSGAGFLFHLYGLVLTSLFLMGMHSTFFGPVKYSILPQHLHEQELLSGNALVEGGTFLAILLGTIAGGVLGTNAANGAVGITVALLMVAVLGYLTGSKIPPAPPLGENRRVDWNPFRTTGRILGFAKKEKSVFLSILGISWFWFFGASVLSLLPIYVRTLGARPQVLTFFIALFSIGIGIGSILCAKLSKQKLELGLVPVGSIGISLFTADWALRGTPDFLQFGVKEILNAGEGIHLVLDLFLLAIFCGFYTVPLYTLIQERAPKDQRSSVIAANNVLNACFMVAASLILLLLLEKGFNIPQVFLLLAILNVAAAIYIFLNDREFLSRFGTKTT